MDKIFGNQHRPSSGKECLLELQAELKKAYSRKALNAQVAENEARRMAESIESRIANEVSRCLEDCTIQIRVQRDREDRQMRTDELKAGLKRQVEEKQEEKKRVAADEAQERRVLVELDRVREEKEAREKALGKEQLVEQLQREGLVQSEIREIVRRNLEELEVAETEQRRAYAAELDARLEKLKALRAEARERREKAILSAAKMLLELQNQWAERRRLLADLLLGEVKYDAELEAREAEMARRQKNRKLAEDLEEQIRFEEECRLRFLEREREFAEAVMAKVMESETIERLSARVRKQRISEYREELERLMRERENARLEELARLRLALEEERHREEIEREEDGKARMALLEEHVDSVAGFMNKKMLRKEERGLVDGARKKQAGSSRVDNSKM